MKLHLPKALFAAVLAACAVLGQQAYAADTVWVNFGTNAVPADTTATEGLGAPGVWNNITGSSTAAVNGTHNLTDEQGAQKAVLQLNAAQNPWGPNSATKTDVLTNMKSSYLDLNENNQWTISLASDYMFSDLSLYLSGDGKQFSPVAVNGSNYIGGTNVAAGATTGWGTREVGTAISDANTVTVTAIQGAISASNVSVGDAAKRATLAGLSLTNTTAAHSWNTTMTENAAAADLFWSKGASAVGSEWNSAGAVLNVTAAEGGSSLAVDGASELGGIVAEGNLTVTSSDTVTVGTLWATAGSSLTFNATLTTGSDLTSGGFGTVTIGADQTLGNVTIASGNTFHVADGVSIVANGNVANGGTITGGEGASFFANLAAGTALASGGVSVTANQAAKADMLGGTGANLMVTDGTSVDINSTGTGAVKILKQGEGTANVTIGTLSLANGSNTTINAGEGVTLSNTATDRTLDGGTTLTVGEGVTIANTGVSHLGSATLNIDGGTYSTGSMLGQDLGGGKVTKINITGGLFEVTNTDTNRGGYKGGSIRLAHWPGSNSTLNVLGGEFRALGAEIGMGDDGTATVNISGTGVVNTRGIYAKGGSAINLSNGGTLNLGANGLFGGTGTLTVSGTGATLGALADWHVENDVAINMTDASLTVNTGDAKTIDLTGANLTTSNTSISLAGSGTLLIGSAINGAVNLAESSGAALEIANTFTAAESKIMLNGEESANGFLTANYQVMNLGSGQSSNLTSVAMNGATLDFDGTTGVASGNTGIFVVGSSFSSSDMAAYVSDTNSIQINNGATLTVDTATLAKDVTVSGAATMNIGADSTVSKSQVSLQDGASLTLTGSGNYVLNGTSALGATLGADWTGTVVVQNHAENNINLAPLAKANSVIEMNGFSGWTGNNLWKGTNTQNIKLTDTATGVAWDCGAFSSANDTCTFSGDWSGTGTFKTTGTPAGNMRYMNYTFSGDVSKWTGSFVKASTNTSTTLTFTGKAEEVNAAVTYENQVGNLHVVADADTTFKSTIKATDLTVNEGKNVTFESTVTLDNAMTVNGTATFKTQTTFGTVVNSGTLNFDADAVTVTTLTLNAGSVIQLKDDDSGVLTTSALTVGGDATINGDLVIADEGSLTMSGVITMGCALTLGTGITLDADTIASVQGGATVTLFEGVDGLTLGTAELTLGDSVQAETVFANLLDGPMDKYFLNYNDDKTVTLSLTVVPEPATATLSLLALAGLAARRRRH